MNKVDDADIVTVEKAFPRIASVSALDRFLILVKWKTGKQQTIDLAPTVLTFKVYAPLCANKALFASVHVVNQSVIAWGDDDAIDMHVSELERLAGETMEGCAFQTWMKEMGLTRDSAAALLGISRRTIGYYIKSDEVPRVVYLACRQLKSERLERTTA